MPIHWIGNFGLLSKYCFACFCRSAGVVKNWLFIRHSHWPAKPITVTDLIKWREKNRAHFCSLDTSRLVFLKLLLKMNSVMKSQFCKKQSEQKALFDLFITMSVHQAMLQLNNLVYHSSMEVGVCVEAYRHEMEVSQRHINSAFMTFVVLNAEGQPRTLPVLKPETGVRNSGTWHRRWWMVIFSGMTQG